MQLCNDVNAVQHILDWYKTHKTLNLAAGLRSLELPARAMRKHDHL